MNSMERSEFDKRLEKNHWLARQQGIALSDNIFVNTSKGRRYFRRGVGQRKASDGKR